jgi:hypothetical protein
MDESRLIEKLEILVRTLSDADSAPDVFRGLVEGLPLVAPRSAIYLVRQSSLKGWRCLGYPANAAEGLRALSVKADSPASRIGTDGLADHRSDGMPSPNFGQSPPHESVAVTVTVKSKPIALIVAERNTGESPWHPSALSLLAHTARLRLELSLTERKSATETTTDSASAAPTRPPATPSASQPSHVAPAPPAIPRAMPTTAAPQQAAPQQATMPVTPQPPAPPQPAPQMAAPQTASPPTPTIDASAAIEAAVPMMAPPSLPQTGALEGRPSAPSTPSSLTPAAAAPAADPRLDAAKRFARLVATDIRLYNEEAVVLGRRNGDLADRLEEPIALGERSFNERFGDMGPDGTQLLQQALIEILAGGDRSLLRV